MSEEQEEYLLRLHRAEFGDYVQKFLNDDIGKYLILRAEEEKKDAVDKLISCDVGDTKTLMSLQVKAQVAKSVIDWLCEAILDGRQALNLLENGDS